MQSIILERDGISYLEYNAIATVSRDETPVQCRYPRSDYSERPTAYVVTLNGRGGSGVFTLRLSVTCPLSISKSTGKLSIAKQH